MILVLFLLLIVLIDIMEFILFKLILFIKLIHWDLFKFILCNSFYVIDSSWFILVD